MLRQSVHYDTLFEILAADRDYYTATGGGVTFTGGECMLYPEFMEAMGKRCREAGISVAIDTAGNVPWSAFEIVLPFTDLFLYDIKCPDPELHKKGTGQKPPVSKKIHNLPADFC